MLLNLDRSFERRGDHRSLGWVSDLRVHIPEAAVGDRIQLAGRLLAFGRFDAAATVLEQAASRTAGSPERDRLLAQATSLRARLN
jgi:hypothetical protein